MTKRKFDSIVKKVVKLGNLYREEMEKLEEWCEEKYGCNWSDLGCDSIIDSLEFGEGPLKAISFEDFKNEITNNL